MRKQMATINESDIVSFLGGDVMELCGVTFIIGIWDMEVHSPANLGAEPETMERPYNS